MARKTLANAGVQQDTMAIIAHNARDYTNFAKNTKLFSNVAMTLVDRPGQAKAGKWININGTTVMRFKQKNFTAGQRRPL